MGESIEGRDGSEGKPGGHQQGVVPSLIGLLSEKTDHWVEPEYLAGDLSGQENEEDHRCCGNGAHADQGTRPEEVEGGQESDAQGAHSAYPQVIPGSEFCQHYPCNISWKDRFAARPARQRPETEQNE